MIDNKKLILEQKAICQKFDASFVETSLNIKVGISRNVEDGVQPINGLRHPIEGDTSGWYIWAGEEIPNSPDFFEPLHVLHLEEWCPSVLKYLGLAPGWRFMIDNNGFEDVWEDLSLLEI